MTKQRTRTRARKPASTGTTTTARSGGVETVGQEHDEHRPARDERLEAHGDQVVGYVTVKDGVTLNMTDYNSFRRDIGVELPVQLGSIDDVVDADGRLMPGVRDHLDRVYNALAGWVGEKHEETVQDASDYFQEG